MEQIPFFPKLVIYGPIIFGSLFFLLSLSKKQRTSLIESLGENGGEKAHVFLRYGGIVLILVGIIQYFIRDL